MTYLEIMQNVVAEYIEVNADRLLEYEYVADIADDIYSNMFDVLEYTGVLGLEYSVSIEKARKLVLFNIADVMEAGSWYAYTGGEDTYNSIGKAFCSGDFRFLDSLARHAFLNDAVNDVVNAFFKSGGEA